jgi:hypothetical protein
MSLLHNDKAIHWAEALGLSAAVHAGAAFLLFNFSVDLDRLIPDAPPERAELLITSLVLDTNALVSATNQAAGVEEVEEIDAANELNDGVNVDPELLEPVNPDENFADPVEPVDPVAEVVADIDEPEDITEPEALAEVEAPETVEEIEALEDVAAIEAPEDVAAVEAPEDVAAIEAPEDVAAVEAPEDIAPIEAPEDLAAVTIEPETIEGTDLADTAQAETAPEEIAPVEQAGDLTPEAISPLRPEVPELSPTGTAALGNAPQRLAAVAPAALSPERIAPRAVGIGTISTAAATRPTRSLPTVAPPAPGTPEAVVSELVNRIRANVSSTCLIAIPQQATNGAPELVIVTASEADVAPYAAAILDGVEPRPGQRSVLVDARQCAVLDYVRQNRSYPAFRMAFSLTEDQINSGDQLVGAIGRTAGRYVSLVIVDDNGVVQDLGQYLSFVGNEARFDVPLRRAGSARDTKQLLVAIGTNSRPSSVDAQNGQLATTYFEALNAEVGNNVPIVMLPFDVR